MAQPASQLKVLRIAVLEGPKIKTERLLRPGEAVTIGASPKNTFVLPGAKLPRPDYPLFTAKGNKYTLQFTEQMKGKVSSGTTAAYSIEKLRTDAGVERDGAMWRVPLTEQDRGKVKLDDTYVVLFQFVPAPPMAAMRPQRVDFHPRMVEEDDALLFGFMLLFGALAVICMVWVALTPVEEITSIEQLDEKWTMLIVKPPEKPPEPEKEVVDDRGKKAPETPKEAKVEQPVVEAAKEPVERPPELSAEEKKRLAAEKVKARSAVLNFATTRGSADAASGTAQDRFSEGGAAKAAASLAGAGSVEVNAGTSARVVESGPGEAADIAKTKVEGGTIAAPTVEKVKIVEVVTEPGTSEDDIPEGDMANIKAVVTRSSAQLKYCYDQRLNVNPDLAGRVEIEWMITGGRVTAASVFTNTTGDDEFAACIVKKVKMWSFPTEITNQVQWPFIFRQKQ